MSEIPDLINEWLEKTGKYCHDWVIVSLLTLHTILGQELKDIVAAIDKTIFDMRINVILFAPSRYGKSLALMPIIYVSKITGKKAKPITSFSDEAFLGKWDSKVNGRASASMDTNREIIPDRKGLLLTTDILCSHEARVFFSGKDYKKDILSYLAVALDTIGNNRIIKTLQSGVVSFTPTLSMFLISTPVKFKSRDIFEIGIFQRCLFYYEPHSWQRRYNFSDRASQNVRFVSPMERTRLQMLVRTMLGREFENDEDIENEFRNMNFWAAVDDFRILGEKIRAVSEFAHKHEIVMTPESRETHKECSRKLLDIAKAVPNIDVAHIVASYAMEYANYISRLSFHHAAMRFSEKIEPCDIEHAFQITKKCINSFIAYVEKETLEDFRSQQEGKKEMLQLLEYLSRRENAPAKKLVGYLQSLWNVSSQSTIYRRINEALGKEWITRKSETIEGKYQKVYILSEGGREVLSVLLG